MIIINELYKPQVLNFCLCKQENLRTLDLGILVQNCSFKHRALTIILGSICLIIDYV